MSFGKTVTTSIKTVINSFSKEKTNGDPSFLLKRSKSAHDFPSSSSTNSLSNSFKHQENGHKTEINKKPSKLVHKSNLEKVGENVEANDSVETVGTVP